MLARPCMPPDMRSAFPVSAGATHSCRLGLPGGGKPRNRSTMHVPQGSIPTFPLLSRVVAAPSWVVAGTVHDNCTFLSGKVSEVGLCLFEAEACLTYSEADLPAALASLPLSWHAHLPVDLHWGKGRHGPPGAGAASVCAALMDKVAFLGATRAVLHPPTPAEAHVAGFPGAGGPARLLAAFLEQWARRGRNTADLLLENIAGQDLVDLIPVVLDGNCNVCLDMGHLLTYGQHGLSVSGELLRRVRMVHVHAPGGGDRHRPLDELTPEEAAWAARMLPALPAGAVLMVEVFAWEGVAASLPVLERLLGGKAAAA